MMIFIIIWSIWLISEMVFNRLLRSGKNDKKDKDKGTISIIWVTIGIAISLGILATIFLNIPISNSFLIPYLGLLLILLGIVFRFISILTLGRLFTVDVTIRDNHKIKKDGVYRLIRHPSYAGLLLSFIGLGISVNNWLSLIIVTILVTMAIIYRIKIEENTLIEQFGEEYLDYMKRTCRLIPWIY